ncbi:MAG: T9SS type A sorting domain-containing protein [Candidatus Azobacteroides sp.]|nr:T9SS type A sorting domain-containing protein [Candidatus Azobacteroides sp.]
MKIDLYSKIVFTVIALCLILHVIKDFQLIPSLNAQDDGGTFINANELLNGNYLKTNADGSLNVRLAAADVIEVKPASGARFVIEPYSSSAFKVEPYDKYNTKFKIEPYDDTYTKFNVAPYDHWNTKFPVVPYDANTNFQVKPATNAVFTVKEAEASSLSSTDIQPSYRVYPNPAKEFITIEYSPENQTEYMYIYNLEGNIMDYIILHPDSNRLTLNVSSYPSGTYIFAHRKNSGKFIVER